LLQNPDGIFPSPEGGEMIQALYAHMNNKTIKKKRILIYTKAKKKN
jgi:hypothetical protein